MLDNVGITGLLLIAVIIGLPIWLIVRSSKKKSREQARIAAALEKISRSETGADKTR